MPSVFWNKSRFSSANDMERTSGWDTVSTTDSHLQTQEYSSIYYLAGEACGFIWLDWNITDVSFDPLCATAIDPRVRQIDSPVSRYLKTRQHIILPGVYQLLGVSLRNVVRLIFVTLQKTVLCLGNSQLGATQCVIFSCLLFQSCFSRVLFLRY